MDSALVILTSDKVVVGLALMLAAVVYVSMAQVLRSVWAPFVLAFGLPFELVRWAMRRRHEAPAALRVSPSGRRNYLPSNAELAWDAEHRRTCRRCAREHATIEARVMAEETARVRTIALELVA